MCVVFKLAQGRPRTQHTPLTDIATSTDMLFLSDCRKCLDGVAVCQDDTLILCKEIEYYRGVASRLDSKLDAKDNMIVCLITLIACLFIWIIAAPTIRELARRAHELWAGQDAGEDEQDIQIVLFIPQELPIMPVLRKWLPICRLIL